MPSIGLKLTDQAMKLLERVLDTSIHWMVNIYSMQFGFVPGCDLRWNRLGETIPTNVTTQEWVEKF